MNTPAKIAGFTIAIAAVFGAAIGIGQAVGPATEPDPPAHRADHDQMPGGEHPSATGPPTDLPGGLVISQNGYTLNLAEQQSTPGRDVPVAFTIDGPDGQPVTAYDIEHEKRLHLIAVRRDFSGFQHVHPSLDEDGVWRTTLDLTPGSWRLFADFTPTEAAALTLGADLSVPGDYQPATSTGDSRVAHIDGYTITLDGELAPGADAKLSLNVTRNDQPVTDLEPYLGAYGHLVALREGDLAYLHVHPDGQPDDGVSRPGPDIVFYATVPTVGGYRLFLDFKHEGVVRTAAFTVSTEGTSGSPNGDATPTGAEHTPSGHAH